MSLELVHTSVEKGLRGVSGFATAVATRGLPVGLEPVLEELSAYDFDASRTLGADRVDWGHRIVTLGGRAYSVLTRIAPCGSDWSGRANRVAHHVVLDAAERAPAGPAWILASMRGLADAVPAVEERPSGPAVPQAGSLSPRPAAAWTAAGFDAGWAGIVARALLEAQGGPCYLVLPAETDALPLLEDVFALLPEDQRWHVTFSTRFQRVAANTKCQLRCVRKGAPSLAKLLAEPGVRQIHADHGGSAGESQAATAGRNGTLVEGAQRASLRVEPVLRAANTARAAEPAMPRPSVSRGSTLTPAEAEREFDLDAAEAQAVAPTPTSRAIGGNPIAVILFAFSAVALLISFVLAVLIVLRR
jgi:hypothetical protein